MNLTLKTTEFELELTYAEQEHIEPTLLAIMATLKGASFLETYYQVQKDIEERKTAEKVDNGVKNCDRNGVKNYIEPVEGVRTHENGVKEYKCSYSCTCGNKGIRYIHEDSDTTTCHKCKGELSVFPSTQNDAHDEEFNYFLAM